MGWLEDDRVKRISRIEARNLIKKYHPNILKVEEVHHIDEDPFNNNPDNLVVIDKKEHKKLHDILRKRRSQKTKQDNTPLSILTLLSTKTKNLAVTHQSN